MHLVVAGKLAAWFVGEVPVRGSPWLVLGLLEEYFGRMEENWKARTEEKRADTERVKCGLNPF